jgi:mono/diheme cytochrome c family protein
MRAALAGLIAAALAASAWAVDPQSEQRGKQEEQRACVPCHSLRLVESQRLSPAAWGKELDKMQRWGAMIKDRQLLLDYLSQEYPDTKPTPQPERSADGTKGSAQAH